MVVIQGNTERKPAKWAVGMRNVAELTSPPQVASCGQIKGTSRPLRRLIPQSPPSGPHQHPMAHCSVPTDAPIHISANRKIAARIHETTDNASVAPRSNEALSGNKHKIL